MWFSAILSLLSSETAALQFYLRGGQTRCFQDTAAPATRVIGEYTIAAGEGYMPVDIFVKFQANGKILFEKPDAGHGKFAFVTPHDEHDAPQIMESELKRIVETLKNQVVGKNSDLKVGFATKPSHGRRLLNVGSEGLSQSNSDSVGTGRTLGQQRFADDHSRDAVSHHAANDATGEQHGRHDYYDPNWDINSYQGIDEEALGRMEQHEADVHFAAHQRAHHDSAGQPHVEYHHHDPDSEGVMDVPDIDEAYEDRPFTICVRSTSNNSSQQRRVKIVVHKGDTAHDYERLAKIEHMSNLEVALAHITDELRDLMHGLEQAHKMEEALRSINHRTNRNVIFYAGVSMMMLFIIGAGQTRYTTMFLKRKKVA